MLVVGAPHGLLLDRLQLPPCISPFPPPYNLQIPIILRCSLARRFSSPTEKMSSPTVHGPPPKLSPSFLAQSRVPAIYAAVITVSVLCTVAVALRFLCRRLVKAVLWWDDWTILAALFVEWGLSAVVLHQTADLNFGRHIELMKPWQLVSFAKTLLATQVLYYCAQTLIKISLLLLYHRLFSVNKPFRIALFAAGALVVIWWTASFWDTIFQCVPVQASWDKSIKNARCQRIRDAALGTGISNLILDLVFLLLPVPMVWRLHVSRRVKVSLTGIFLLGALYVDPHHRPCIAHSLADNDSVCATSVIRIHQVLATNWSLTDLTYDSFGINVWSTVESCCAIIGACLPTMRPLITRSVAVVTSHTKSSASKTKTSSGSGGAVSSPRSPFWNLPGLCALYQSLNGRVEENDVEKGGRNAYPLKPLQAFAKTTDPYPKRISSLNGGWDRSPHPVVKSERFQLERQIALLPLTPEPIYLSSPSAPERIRRATSKTAPLSTPKESAILIFHTAER